jgi:hypothetical protein
MLVGAILGTLNLVAFAFVAYWGLVMRSGLVVGVYRKQALGLSAIALYIVLFNLIIALGPEPTSSQALVYANDAFDVGLLFIIMLWISITAEVARRADPFERDSLRFSVTKYLWFAAVIVPVFVTLVLFPEALIISASPPLPFLVRLVGWTPYGIAFVFGGLVLLVSAMRSKDRTLQAHLRWFGLFMTANGITLVVTTVLVLFFGGNYQLVGLSGYLTYAQFEGLFLFSSYCLYRSAKSLALTTTRLDDAGTPD